VADDDTIDRIYQAVGDLEQWRELLGRLSDPVSPDLRAHIEIARQAHERHTGLASGIAALAGVHARLGIAAVLVEALGTVTWQNRAATRLFNDPEGALQLVDGGIRVADAREHATLAAAIAAVASTSGRAQMPFVLVSRPGRGPLTIVALRPPSASPSVVEERRRVLLLVLDPDGVNPPSTRTIRDLFGFTAREAECAVLLMEGRTVDEAARLMGVRRSTVRTFLARMTAKTDSHSQAEFVARLLSIPHGIDVA
jgi:DNA-binding CsgD family transcriptional regulator